MITNGIYKYNDTLLKVIRDDRDKSTHMVTKVLSKDKNHKWPLGKVVSIPKRVLNGRFFNLVIENGSRWQLPNGNIFTLNINEFIIPYDDAPNIIGGASKEYLVNKCVKLNNFYNYPKNGYYILNGLVVKALRKNSFTYSISNVGMKQEIKEESAELFYMKIENGQCLYLANIVSVDNALENVKQHMSACPENYIK